MDSRTGLAGSVGTVLVLGIVAACALPAADVTPATAAASSAAPGVTAAIAQQASQQPPEWQLAWRAEGQFPAFTTATTTCRFSTRLTAGGSKLRAEFANAWPDRSYRVLGATIARPQEEDSLDVDVPTSLPLTFDGSASVEVDAGAPVLSDPIPMAVDADSDVLVTVTATAGPAFGQAGTADPGACSSGPVADPSTMPAQQLPEIGRVRWLRSLLVEGPPVRSIVALGDSLTDGPDYVGSHQRWSDQLVQPGVAVVNAGVRGGGLSCDGVLGTADGVSRARALLAQPNVDDLVMLLGTNDLSFDRSSEQILAAVDRVATLAADAGVRLWVGTVLPRGARPGGWTERNRLEVNDALRGGRFGDKGVRIVDTGAALADPSAPSRLRSSFGAGDGVHLNLDGTRALASAFAQALGLTV